MLCWVEQRPSVFPRPALIPLSRGHTRSRRARGRERLLLSLTERKTACVGAAQVVLPSDPQFGGPKPSGRSPRQRATWAISEPSASRWGLSLKSIRASAGAPESASPGEGVALTVRKHAGSDRSSGLESEDEFRWMRCASTGLWLTVVLGTVGPHRAGQAVPQRAPRAERSDEAAVARIGVEVRDVG